MGSIMRPIDWDAKAPCKRCGRLVPISANTLQVEGVVCMRCQVTTPSPEELHVSHEIRLRELEEEAAAIRVLMAGSLETA